jgi:hypothetical protein
MKVDRTTKMLLLMIALGLWLNAIGPFLHVRKVSADTDTAVQSIASDMNKISGGRCLNTTICR